ncbi:MAG TPA: type IIL restriction-modification enzyme MmeI [Thermoanaerobaculia bacterium]|nr:type IIL restriction-modification enzyme MmeI [Thermoanaerobaculia bacterium]
MSDLETEFHKTWLGMAQPVEGLVVSIPVLVEAQCLSRLSPEDQQLFRDLCPPVSPKEPEGPRAIRDFGELLSRLLGWPDGLVDVGDAVPRDLSYYAPEGHQEIRPSRALRRVTPPPPATAATAADTDSTPASRAAAPYLILVWELPDGLPFDKPETVTGPWEYPPAAKFVRLLEEARVPVGLLTNRRAVRLVYAPRGESTGSITFKVDDMAVTGGRPLLEAFVLLLKVQRLFGVKPEHQLPALLAESRKRQLNVTEELAGQVLEALGILLRGFEDAAGRDGRRFLDEAAREGDHLYGGLLTVLLRLVFLLYSEDRGLLPVEDGFYSEHLSVLGLFERLQEDQGAFPDTMSRRYGAWDRLLALFRTVYFGARHGGLHLPERRGDLFKPDVYPFLEGWPAGGSAPAQFEDLAAVRVPSIDDGTVYRLLEKLLVLEGQRLSYRALDVEQIGSVYEALMGYHVVRVYHPAVCLRPSRVWVEAHEVLQEPPSRRAKWLQETAAIPKAQAEKLAAALSGVRDEEEALRVLEAQKVKHSERALPGRLVLQPGPERRRTSSHYTPRSLTEPIVRRTLEPLLATMGPEPPSRLILELRICDPAMGSGAFLVAACRYLADQLVAAWTREGRLAEAGPDPLNHARRLVAQKCLYGVDKNPFAVSLAKLSLWLVTLAKDLPFTFVDHALRHGDSLVGLTFEQIRGFHWKPSQQMDLCSKELDAALEEAIQLRQQIQELADDPSSEAQKQKEKLLWDAEDATRRARLIGDLVIGAFFSAEKDKARQQELGRRLVLVNDWLASGGPEPEELLEMQQEIRGRLPVFHWMLEFPEVFYAERPDPLDGGRVNREAWMDGFAGNPPFLGQSQISALLGGPYRDWLFLCHPGSKGKSDLSPHFLRRAETLIGPHGAVGMIATKTVAQGDSRRSGLKYLIGAGCLIYDATRRMDWPGAANVVVSVVHFAKGRTADAAFLHPRLNGASADFINSRLRAKPERPDPSLLQANSPLSYIGVKPYGEGFILTPSEREHYLTADPQNDSLIWPIIGGEEINNSPSQTYNSYVIDFGPMPLSEAQKWPVLLARIEELVKPERQSKSRSSTRTYWWQFGERQPAMRAAITNMKNCWVTARVTKHLCISLQPTSRIFNEKIYVFPTAECSFFSVMQSRIHSSWTWLLSSTMKNDLNYSATDCFETFPFPQPDPRTVLPELEDIGQRLYETRARYMIDTQQGLTATYNRLKDPACHDPRIEELRRLHEEMDRAVLAAYGWSDIPVPPYGTPTTDAERKALEAFEDEVIDRLFVLNAERAEEERKAALSLDQQKKGAGKDGAAAKPRRGRKPKGGGAEEGGGQGQLF